MSFIRSLGLAAAIGVAANPALAPAQDRGGDSEIEAALRTVQRLAFQYTVLFARTAVDLTYESIAIDPRTGQTVLNGLEIRPRFGWDPARACTISIERAAGTGSSEIDTVESNIDLSGITIAAECFDPGVGAMMQSFGYGELSVQSAALHIAYDLPSSGAEVLLTADVEDAAEIAVTADFEYVWIAGIALDEDGEPGEPEPVAKLTSAEIAFENTGIWERLRPMVEANMGDPSQLPQMVGPLLGQALTQPGQPLGQAEEDFIANVQEEVGRFVAEGDRLVVALRPEGGLWLDDGIFQTPGETIRALNPRVSAAPIASERIVAPSLLASALAGGEGLSEEDRLAAGRALVRGVGAPRAVAEGMALIRPLAENWQPEAALLMAEAMAADGNTADAYGMALRALAGEADGALATVDRLETDLGTAAILSRQGTALAAWPDADAWTSVREEAVSSADIGAMRRAASAAASGRGLVRTYAEAYRLASLAAAAGDAGALALRERIDARFTGAGGTIDPAWAEARDEAASAALEAWTAGGLGERVMARYGRTE